MSLVANVLMVWFEIMLTSVFLLRNVDVNSMVIFMLMANTDILIATFVNVTRVAGSVLIMLVSTMKVARLIKCFLSAWIWFL